MSTFLKSFGNLTIVAQPELKHSPKGTAFAKFRAVHNEKVNNNGTWTEEACFISCIVFNKQAEYVGNHLNKGAKIAIVGTPKADAWIDKKTGEPRAGFDIKIDTLEVIYNPKRDLETSNRTNPKISTYKKKETSFADDIADDNAMSDQDASWGDDEDPPF